MTSDLRPKSRRRLSLVSVVDSTMLMARAHVLEQQLLLLIVFHCIYLVVGRVPGNYPVGLHSRQ